MTLKMKMKSKMKLNMKTMMNDLISNLDNENLLNNMICASDFLKKFDTWVIFTHKNADGDTLGSASALFETGIASGRNVSWMGPDAELPHAYRFLNHSDKYRACLDEFKFNDINTLYIFLDCANETRSVNLDKNLNFSDFNILNIDHHEDNTRFGTVNCVAPECSSTAELLTLILKAGNWNVTLKIAKSLYTGMWTDTGGFSFSSTKSRTHRLIAEFLELGVDAGEMNDAINQTKTVESMALWGRALSRIKIFGKNKSFAVSWLESKDFAETGAVISDTEGLPACLMMIEGVRVSAFITELDEKTMKISLRSRPGSFGAADIARAIGGGGHPRAAGAVVQGKTLKVFIDEIMNMMILNEKERENA